ncbi:hypothetical protein BJX99DRAFT_251973 [Aspergillus californicus]
MELTWLVETPQSRRRSRALRACPGCQKRKKRCRHLGPEVSNSGQELTAGLFDAPRKSARTGLSSRSPEVTPPTEDRSIGMRSSLLTLRKISLIERFINAPDGTHLRDRVGLWINTPVSQRLEKGGVEIPDTFSLQAENFSKYNHLLAIYFSTVNRILPLVDHESFNLDRSKGELSVFLERAICLVAAKDKAAVPHLRLATDGPLLTTRKFCFDVYNGLVCAMDVGLKRDRITGVRILALMSLHSEGYEGAETASMQICQAIHQAQTAGLHLERPNRLPGDSLSNLFWCLWTLDKLHASIGGRPVLLADRDIGIKRPDFVVEYSKSAFDIWFALSELLSKVISFYRPFASYAVGWETNYPSFEDIMGDHVRDDLEFATLGSFVFLRVLELYYHAISILPARYRPFQRPGGSRPSYTRQGLAAVRIYSLVANECAHNLPPLPIIPYAVALAMGVAYHQIRSSKIITHVDRAKGSLEACCTLLEEIGVFWDSAEAMARLGKKVLRQIDGSSYENDQPSQVPLLSTTVNSGGDSLYNNAASAAKDETLSAKMRLSSHFREGNHPSRDELSTAAVTEQSVPLSLDEQHCDMRDAVGGNGFADIDILFDDFLDLSLPTNF